MCVSKHIPWLAYLQPPKGLALKLKEGATWIGRGTFELSSKGQGLCSRRQACIYVNNVSIDIECEGINPLQFVICKSQNFQSFPASQANKLYQLPKGKRIQLMDGDQFFLASFECLITVVIRVHLDLKVKRSHLDLSPCLHLEHRHGSKETLLSDSAQGSKSSVDISGRGGEIRALKQEVADLPTMQRSLSYILNESAQENQFPFQVLDASLVAEDMMSADVMAAKVNNSSSHLPVTNLLSFHQRKPFSSGNGDLKDGPELISSPCVEDCRPATGLSAIMNSGGFHSTILIAEDHAGATVASSLVHTEDAADVATRSDLREAMPLSSGSLGTNKNKKQETDTPMNENLCENEADANHAGATAESSLVHTENSADAATRSDLREAMPLSSGSLENKKQETGTPMNENLFENELEIHQRMVKDDKPVMGVDSIIVTISGYPQSERDKLVRLIRKTGSYYVGGLSKDKAVTHVVCWRFSGKKYELARKWGKIIVNHCWFEDCLVAGKRLCEKPYTLASGEVMGRVKWDDQGETSERKASKILSAELKQHLTAIQVQSDRLIDCIPEAADVPKQNEGFRDHAAFYYCERSEENPLIVSMEETLRDIPHKPRGRHSRGSGFATEEIHLLGDRFTANQKKLRGTWSNHYDEAKASSCKQQKLVLDCFQKMERELLSKPIPNSFDMNAATEPSVSQHNKRSQVFHKVGLYEQLLRKRGKRQILTKDQTGHLRSSWKNGKFGDESSTSYCETIVLDREINNVLGCPPSPVSCNQAPVTCLEDEAEPAAFPGTDSSISQTREAEVTCVICQDQSECVEEGLLTCGHKFCFPCIRKWAYKVQTKAPSCPLCKAPFDFIIKKGVVEKGNDNAVAFIGTCKEASEMIVMVAKQDPILNLVHQQELLCINCQSRDTDELLMVCNSCGERAAHTFCLDPPWPAASGIPWFCAPCTRSFR